jgi:hypothetical protein
MDALTGAIIPPHDTTAGRYSRCGRNLARVHCDVACTVEEVVPAIYRIVNFTSISGPSLPPSTLWEVLEQWVSMWMWEDLEMTRSFEFLVAAIIDGSLACVPDGSYIKELYPDICSAAFILEWRLLHRFRFAPCRMHTPPLTTIFVHPSLLHSFIFASCLLHTPPL